ncbi:related to methyltransferase [Cephalotrichum gorgonifer]|uniref:Related to methyltransferase n=1 Tax=Cephalotrichum gorgonifer TaxID=2041049 RepID=A0AAE8N6V1_9PEZI|nr:related to methyltransferase [Cephalotrichum gorgonifer]
MTSETPVKSTSVPGSPSASAGTSPGPSEAEVVAPPTTTPTVDTSGPSGDEVVPPPTTNTSGPSEAEDVPPQTTNINVAEATLLEADEVEEQENVLSDGDSGVGSFQSSTASLQEELIKQRKEHGRSYKGYLEAKYLLPMDEQELERLELQNHLVWLTLDKRLYHSPVENFNRVLDVGCGTGQWTIEFADQYPGTEVIGVDLAPVQPNAIPPNLVFEVDDLEQPWTFSKKFDFIHTEAMVGALQDWPKYFRQSFEFLEPGGYLELHDVDFAVRCDDGTLPDDSAVVKWHEYMDQAADKMGFPLHIVLEFPKLMQEAGYTDISVEQIKWPMNTWPKDKKYKELGYFASENFRWGCESMSLALLTRGLGWSVDEVRVFMALLRKDFANRQLHGYWNFYVIHGRKPENVA